MTDVTTDQVRDEMELSAADEQLVRELTERARTGGLKLTGEGGLLGKLTKMVVEGALEGELDDHLGYGKHAPAGRNGGNSRNGHRAKTVLTDTGALEITVPRDRDASFEPKIVAKRQRRLTGIDEMVICSYSPRVSGRAVWFWRLWLAGSGWLVPVAGDSPGRVVDWRAGMVIISGCARSAWPALG